ncbi:MAG: FGGY-family carbohydrate kinase [Oscillibacter sp.]
MNVGGAPVRSRAGLVTTVGWSLNGETTYALEGSASSTRARPFNGCATSCKSFRPRTSATFWQNPFPTAAAFTWCPRSRASVRRIGICMARGCVVGITRGTTKAHFARAVLESIAYQVTDLMTAMRQDAGCEISLLRVDGGASVSDLMMQFQADLLRIPVDRPAMVETTAFGAALLAGLAAGVWKDLTELSTLRCSERVFTPERAQYECEELYRGWKRAVGCAQGWVEKK